MPDEQAELDPKLVAKLRSKKLDQREEAEQELNRLGPEAVDALLKLLEKEGARRRKRRLFGVVLLSTWAAVLVIMLATGNGSQVGSFTGMIGGMVALFAATQLQKDAATALTRYDDIRSVGPLAEALEFEDKGVATEASGALVRLLPRLRASDHAVLTPDQRRCLDRSVVKRRNADLTMAVLAAYEQIGDETSVELVERIAAGEVKGIGDQRVIAYAGEILPAMRRNAELVKAAQTLLRPADAAESDMLLRPAGGAPDGPEERLLRPWEAAPEDLEANDAEPEKSPALRAAAASADPLRAGTSAARPEE